MYVFSKLIEAEKALEQFIPAQLPRPAYTLEHVAAFMEYAGNPQDKVKAIHLAGTSGKTSSAYYAAALLKAAGKKVGLLTSPHVETITERVQVNLEPLSEKLFCQELADFMNLVEASQIQLSYAEILYAFAFWEFARLRVDYMVIETGLGGLLDATNIMQREDKVCAITDISLDHTNVLGKTLPEIAEQKAGIIKLHSTVFTYHQAPEIMHELETACRQRQASLHTIPQPGPDSTLTISFLPLFQQRNFLLAQAAVEYVAKRDGLPPMSAAQTQAAAGVHIPGRMESIQYGHHTIILDGAHNPQKLAALRTSVAARYANRPVAAMVSFIQGGGRDILVVTGSLYALAPVHRYVLQHR